MRGFVACARKLTRVAAAVQERETFFNTLKSVLNISQDQHTALFSKVAQDDSVHRIRCAPAARGGVARARASAPHAVEP